MDEVTAYTIIWNSQAKSELIDLYKFICADSGKHARKVFESIVGIVSLLPGYPLRYPADKRKVVNDGSFRAFTKYRYKVAYRVYGATIRILHIRHTSRKTSYY